MEKYEPGTKQHTAERKFMEEGASAGKKRLVLGRFRNIHGEPFTVFGDYNRPEPDCWILGSETDYEAVPIGLAMTPSNGIQAKVSGDFHLSVEETEMATGILEAAADVELERLSDSDNNDEDI